MQICNLYSKVSDWIYEQIGNDLCSYKYNFSKIHGWQKGIIDNKSLFQKIHEPETGV